VVSTEGRGGLCLVRIALAGLHPGVQTPQRNCLRGINACDAAAGHTHRCRGFGLVDAPLYSPPLVAAKLRNARPLAQQLTQHDSAITRILTSYPARMPIHRHSLKAKP